LVDFLAFAHTTDCTAKTDADVGHLLQLSRRASDPYTADESHSSGQCSRFVNRTSTLQTLRPSTYMTMLTRFGFRNKKARLAKFLALGRMVRCNQPKPGGFLIPPMFCSFLPRKCEWIAPAIRTWRTH
jgi:hypothetical protein